MDRSTQNDSEYHIPETGERLKQTRDPILFRWEKLVRLERTEVNRLDSPTLLSTLPRILEAAGDALLQKRPGTDVTRTVRKLAQDHAHDRMRSGLEIGREPSKTLQDLARDYGILRKLSFDALETETPLSRAERETLIETFATANEVAQREVMLSLEGSLSRAEGHLDLALGLASLAIWEIDLPSHQVIWCRSQTELVQAEAVSPLTTLESLLGNVHPEDREALQIAIQGALFDASELDVDYRMLKGSPARMHWVRLRARIAMDPEGRPTRLLGGQFDITEQKTAELQTHEGEFALRSVAESVSQQLIVHRPDGSIESANRRYLEYFDITMEDLAQSDFSELIHPDDYVSAMERWMVALSEGRATSFEYRLRRRDGRARWHVAQAMPILGPTGQIERWLTTNTDIHDSREALEFLKHETELRERIVEIIAADLRAPLHAARTGTQMIAKSSDKTERIGNLGTRIEENIAKAEKLIRDLTDAVRLHLGEKTELHFDSCDLKAIAEAVRDEVASLSGAAIEIKAEGDFQGFWAHAELSRALNNWLTERLANGANGLPIQMYLHDDGDQVTVEIQTYGVQFSELMLAQMFDPLASLTPSLSDGTNTASLLSLAAVRGIAEAHFGKLSIESSGTGLTRFTLLLPRDSRQN